VKIRKLAKVKSVKLATKNKKMKDSYNKFSLSLKKEDLTELISIKEDLVENDHVSRE